jgi:hypothetical protein
MHLMCMNRHHLSPELAFESEYIMEPLEIVFLKDLLLVHNILFL